MNLTSSDTWGQQEIMMYFMTLESDNHSGEEVQPSLPWTFKQTLLDWRLFTASLIMSAMHCQLYLMLLGVNCMLYMDEKAGTINNLPPCAIGANHAIGTSTNNGS